MTLDVSLNDTRLTFLSSRAIEKIISAIHAAVRGEFHNLPRYESRTADNTGLSSLKHA